MPSLLVAVLVVSLSASAPAQESAALFDAPLVTAGVFDRYAFLTDLDQDGFEDAVSAWWSTPEWDTVVVKGWRNDGTGKFSARWSRSVAFAPDCRPLRTFACEVDSDGSTDVCVVSASNELAEIRVLRSRGLSAPELLTEYSVTQAVPGHAIPEVRAVVTDFTGDGRADLAYSVNGTLRMLELVPGSGLVLRSTTTPFGSASNVIQGLLEMDANGDDAPDLLAWRGGTVLMIETQGGQPSAAHAYFPGISGYKPATGDLDGDGDRDLVLWGTSTYVVARRVGPAGPTGWTLEPIKTGGPSEYLVDVDRDGDLDGVCCGGSGGTGTPTNTEESTMRVSVNDGTGAFARAIERPWLGSDHLAGIADLDHDGDLDVVSGRCILYARGPLTDPPVAFDSAQTDRTTADIDGDSDPDFVVGLHSFERNLGDGHTADFAPCYDAPPQGTQFVGPSWPGDFDGDGDVDLVVEHVAGSTLLGHRFLENLGGGAFADAGQAGSSGVDFNAGSSAGFPETSLAADADGDGDLDLVTHRYVSSGTSGVYGSRVWWNDGAGYFTAGPEYLDEFIQWIGDLSGDGVPDLVGTTKTCSYCEDAGWHEGLGGGAFGPHVVLSPAAHQWVPFAIDDLDGDGDVDLAIAFQFTLKTFWNDGAGVFTVESVPSIHLSNGDEAHQVWSTDCDGDGRIDLLLTGDTSEPNCVLIVRREPDNSGWLPAVAQVIHPTRFTIEAALCDVDGDGDEDFVTNRLFRNARHSPPQGGRRRQLGAGSPGMNGIVPVLGSQGPFRVGEQCRMRVRGGLGGATGVLTVTRVHGGDRGTRGWIAPTFDQVLARIPIRLSGTPGVAGSGSWTQPYTVLPTFEGETRRYTVEIDDPAAADGIARPNALLVTYGPP